MTDHKLRPTTYFSSWYVNITQTLSCVWQIDVWINDHFCSSNLSFRKTIVKWSEGKQLSDGGKLEERTKLHFDFLSILLPSLLILWLNNDYHVVSTHPFFLLSFCFSASFSSDWSSFIWSWLANWMSHCTDMMNVAVAIQRVQSNQLVSSGHCTQQDK